MYKSDFFSDSKKEYGSYSKVILAKLSWQISWLHRSYCFNQTSYCPIFHFGKSEILLKSKNYCANLFGDPSSLKTSSIRLGPRSKGLKKSSSSLSLMEWYSCFSDLLSMALVTEKRRGRQFRKIRNGFWNQFQVFY